jgi:hypothetical protein
MLIFFLTDDMKYLQTINLSVGLTTVTTTLALEPYSVSVFDSTGNDISSTLTINITLVGGIYQVNIYSLDAISNCSLKIIY